MSRKLPPTWQKKVDAGRATQKEMDDKWARVSKAWKDKPREQGVCKTKLKKVKEDKRAIYKNFTDMIKDTKKRNVPVDDVRKSMLILSQIKLGPKSKLAVANPKKVEGLDKLEEEYKNLWSWYPERLEKLDKEEKKVKIKVVKEPKRKMPKLPKLPKEPKPKVARKPREKSITATIPKSTYVPKIGEGLFNEPKPRKARAIGPKFDPNR